MERLERAEVVRRREQPLRDLWVLGEDVLQAVHSMVGLVEAAAALPFALAALAALAKAARAAAAAASESAAAHLCLQLGELLGGGVLVVEEPPLQFGRREGFR